MDKKTDQNTAFRESVEFEGTVTQEAYFELMKERDQIKAERDALDEKLSKIENPMEGDGYRLAEKIIVSTIMDASWLYGPVSLQVSTVDRNGDVSKGIFIENAPDGVIRAMTDCPYVQEMTMKYGRLYIEPIRTDLDSVLGV